MSMLRWKARCRDGWDNDLVLVVSDNLGRALAVAGPFGEGADRESMGKGLQRTKPKTAKGMGGTMRVEARFMMKHLVECRRI